MITKGNKMEIIIKFILGASVVAFVINFLAIVGYLASKIKDILYRKYRINILGVLYDDDRTDYATYIFRGLFAIGVILFLFGLFYCTGSFIYSFI